LAIAEIYFQKSLEKREGTLMRGNSLYADDVFNELLSFASMFEALAESIATSCNGFHNEDDEKEKGNDVADEKEKTVSSDTKCFHTAFFNLFSCS
jgi:hypothetical protein